MKTFGWTLVAVLGFTGPLLSAQTTDLPSPAWDRQAKAWRYLGPEGKPAFAGTFKLADEFHEGVAHVQRSDGSSGWIKPDGSPQFRSDVAGDRTGSLSEGTAWFVRDGLVGWYDAKGKEILAPQWAPAPLADDPANRDFRSGRAVAGTPAAWGWLDRSGNLFPATGAQRPWREGRAFVSTEAGWRLIDEKVKFVGSKAWDDASAFSEGLALVRDGVHVGYVDKTGKAVIAPGFDRGEDFVGGYAVVEKDHRALVIDKAGHPVLNDTDLVELVSLYRAADPFRVWKFRQTAGGLWGLVNADGVRLSDPVWEEIVPYSEGLAAARRNDRWGWLDAGGAAKVPVSYEAAGDFSEGLAPARVAGKWGYVEPSGLLVTDLLGNEVGAFAVGLAPVRRGDEWGLVDRQGQPVGDQDYQALGELWEGRRAFERNDRWGYLDAKGQVAVAAQFQEVGRYAGGVAWVRQDGVAGFVDKDGKPVGPRGWETADPAEAGDRLPVTKPSLWGLIDRKGAWTLAPKWAAVVPGLPGPDWVTLPRSDRTQYLDASGKPVVLPEGWRPWGPFRENRAFVVRDTDQGPEFGLIDPAGQLVASGWKEVGEGLASGSAPVRTADGWTLVDPSGKALANAGPWTSVGGPDGGWYRVDSTGKTGYVDPKGRTMLPPKYDFAGPFVGNFAEVIVAGVAQRIDRTGKVVEVLKDPAPAKN